MLLIAAAMPIEKTRRHGAVTIDLVLCSVRNGQLQVLVARSAAGAPMLPYTWSVSGEAPDLTVRALARTCTGQGVAWLSFGAPVAAKRHPSGAALSVSYVGVTDPATAALRGSQWHRLDALPALASRQRMMAEAALSTLRLHMDASPVAFGLLPAVFTLSDLQEVYELLLGRRLHKASFRRALQAAYLVDPTDEWRSEGRGRPAQLFRFVPRRRRGSRRSVRFDLLGQ